MLAPGLAPGHAPERIGAAAASLVVEAPGTTGVPDLAAAAVHGPVQIAVQHLDADERAAVLAGELHRRLPGTQIVQCPIGAVVAAHTGPGIVAVVVRTHLEDRTLRRELEGYEEFCRTTRFRLLPGVW